MPFFCGFVSSSYHIWYSSVVAISIFIIIGIIIIFLTIVTIFLIIDCYFICMTVTESFRFSVQLQRGLSFFIDDIHLQFHTFTQNEMPLLLTINHAHEGMQQKSSQHSCDSLCALNDTTQTDILQ